MNTARTIGQGNRSNNPIILINFIYFLDMRHSYRQLEVFVATAREGSLSRAAAHIALSQSAASTALGELERQFGTALFDRVGKSLRLNALGTQLLPKAVAILDQAAELEQLLAGGAGFGHLKVGATLTIGNYLAVLVVADFLRRHPDSRVHLEVRNTASIVHDVANLELDLGLIEGRCNDPAVVTTPWVNDELVVFARPDHPLAGHGPVALQKLLGEPWILRESGSGTRQAVEQALREHFSALTIRMELEHTEAIKRAVEAGLGIGCISRLALRDAFRRGSLVALECPELDLRRAFQFVWHRHKHQSAGAREFVALCRAMTEGVAHSDLIALPQSP